jgi:phage gp29-like protein
MQKWYSTPTNYFADQVIKNPQDLKPSNLKNYPVRVQLERIRQDVQKWRDAIREAEQAWYPHRVKMQQLFNDTVLNGHVFACIDRRKKLTLSRGLIIVDEKENENEQWTKWIQQPVFDNLSSYILDAILYGYSFMWYEGINGDNIEGLTLGKRWFISPDREQYLAFMYAISGIDIGKNAADEIKDWIFYFTTPTETGQSPCGYGLLYKVALYEIFLRNNLGYNGDYIELFAAPFRVGKTRKISELDRAQFEAALRDMGSSGYAVIDPDEEIEFLQGKSSGTGNDVYDNFEQRMERKITKVLLGHPDAMDSKPGKLGAKDEDVQKALDDIAGDDAKYLINNWNIVVLPKLRNNGITIPENLRFALRNDRAKALAQKAENEDRKQVADYIKTLADAGMEIDPKWVSDRIGIPVSISAVKASAPQTAIDRLNAIYQDL